MNLRSAFLRRIERVRMQRFSNAILVVVMALFIGISAISSVSEWNRAQVLALGRFQRACNEARILIFDRLGDSSTALEAGVALFNASETVSRDEWRTFIASLGKELDLHGIQCIGYSQLIRPEQLSSHTSEIRAQGFPSFMVRPESLRPIYSSIIYLEPFNDRNLRAFGFDMLSEPVRRVAMEAARDTGNAQLSGKVLLVQETEEKPQPGALMY